MTPLQIFYDAVTIILFGTSAFYLAIGFYRANHPVRGEANIVRDAMLTSIALSALAIVVRLL